MKKTKVFLIIAVIFIIVAGCFLLSKYKKDEASNKTKPVEATVKKGSIKRSVECNGSIVSNLDVDITCKASGEIIKLPYDISDKVDKGALIAELDPIDEERNAKQAEVQLSSSKAKLLQAKNILETSEKDIENGKKQADANLESAKTKYEDNKSKAERMKVLLEKGHVSQEDCDTAQTSATSAKVDWENAKIALENIETERKALEAKRQDVAIAEAQIKNEEIALEQAKQRLDDTKVYAPIQGVVSKRNVQIGQIVSSPLNNVGGGTVLMTLSDLSRMFILASVDESDIGGIKVGQKVIVTVDAYPGIFFPGDVVRIATQGTNTSNVITFEVKIEVLGEGKEKLKPEMTANVEIIEDERNNVLLLPTEAVQIIENKKFVLMPGMEEGKGEKREVKTGINNGTDVEILSGLKEGETVLVQNGGINSKWSKNTSSQGGLTESRIMMRMATRGGR